MPRTINGEAHCHLRTLFGGGTAGGLSDGQLLERFNARDGPGAERAFAELVGRHGPMVLRVARSILRDRDAAEDAFQAAFLALARRAGSLWVRDSIGPWLHAVTVRLSTRMRSDLARRRLLDDRAASRAPTSCEPVEPDDLGATLHEEIARLPDRHRLPIVLCLVEGLTHDEAARRLGWPVGTVRSRLARGRDRLRDRLARRGISPSAIPIGLGVGRLSSGVVHASLRAATAQAAVSSSNGGLIAATGAVPAGTIAAVIAVLREMTMIQRTLLVVGLVASGVLAAGVSRSAQSEPEARPDRGPSMRAESTSEGKATITRVYQVADLVTSRMPRQRDAVLEMRGGPPNIGVAEPAPASVNFDPLIELLTETVAPGTWTLVDFQVDFAPTDYDEASDLAPGSIRAFYLNLSLIVTHSPEVHDQIVKRLRQLRRLVGPLTNPAAAEAEEQRSSPEAGSETTPSDRAGLDSGAGHPDALPNQAEVERPVQERLVPSNPLRYVPRYVFEHPAQEHMPQEYRITRPTQSEPVSAPDGGDRAEGDETQDQSQRIEALEQKLDAILEELRAIRKDDR